MDININIKASDRVIEALVAVANALDKFSTVTLVEGLERDNKAIKEEKQEIITGIPESPVGLNIPDKKDDSKEEPTISLEKVRERLANLSKSGKQKEVKELLTEFGVKKLSDAKKEDYNSIYQKAGEL